MNTNPKNGTHKNMQQLEILASKREIINSKKEELSTVLNIKSQKKVKSLKIFLKSTKTQLSHMTSFCEKIACSAAVVL